MDFSTNGRHLYHDSIAIDALRSAGIAARKIAVGGWDIAPEPWPEDMIRYLEGQVKIIIDNQQWICREIVTTNGTVYGVRSLRCLREARVRRRRMD